MEWITEDHIVLFEQTLAKNREVIRVISENQKLREELNIIKQACQNKKTNKDPSTRIRKFVKTQLFLYEYGLRPHVFNVFSGRCRKYLNTLSRVEIFLSDTNTYACGRSFPQICEYAYVIFLDPVFTESFINKHGEQQGCIFFVNCSDF